MMPSNGKYNLKKVCGHRVLVKKDDIEEKIGSIVIARADERLEKARTTTGTVIGIGPTAWADPGLGGTNWCEVGDAVLFSQYAGKAFGDDHVLLNDEDIVAVLELKLEEDNDGND